MTEFAMPPVISMSSDEVDDDVAFKVLNQDNLPVIIGEAILKPFGREEHKNKPNIIVFPTRRFDIKPLEHPIIVETDTRVLNQHGNKFDLKFTKTLDAKLRKLEKDSNKERTKEAMKKPLFVTTVKKGEFLEPPPEIASLIGFKIDEEKYMKENRKLYAYASEPRVLNRIVRGASQQSVHKMKCEAAAKAAASVMASLVGVDVNYNRKKSDVPLPYANLMFEKRIHRGSNFSNCLPGHLGDGESAAARAAEARRRALARRKAKNQQVRAAQLRLGSPPPVPGRKHEPVQTEQYLEELFSSPAMEDTCTQTELFLERPVSPFYVPAKTGMDQETQIYPGDLFDFDMEVQPIIEVLVGKTIEQALIEVLEEEELAALREQQRRFLELRATETAEAQRIEEREKRLLREKERRMKEFEEGSRLQKEMEERIAAAVLMQGYMADLLPSVLEGLEAEGFLIDQMKQEIDDAFMPWLIREVSNEVREMVSSRDVLTDIVREILENRAEIYKALNRTPREEEAEEEGPTQEDIVLADHLKLQKEISGNIKREN